MVPKFEEFFLPCLKCLSDGNSYTQAMLRAYVITYFHLNEDDIIALVKSGKKTQLADRVAWTVSYFMQAGLIDAPKRGTYKISTLGKHFLSKHNKGFSKNDLLNIPAFAEFVLRKNENIKKESQDTSNYMQKEEYTPTDIIEDAYNQINDSLSKDLLSKVLELSPAFFENLVVELLVKMGYGGSCTDPKNLDRLKIDFIGKEFGIAPDSFRLILV